MQLIVDLFRSSVFDLFSDLHMAIFVLCFLKFVQSMLLVCFTFVEVFDITKDRLVQMFCVLMNLLSYVVCDSTL